MKKKRIIGICIGIIVLPGLSSSILVCFKKEEKPEVTLLAVIIVNSGTNLTIYRISGSEDSLFVVGLVNQSSLKKMGNPLKQTAYNQDFLSESSMTDIF